MLILRGAPALSPFRWDKLAQKLSAIDPAIRLLHCEFVHFAHTDEALSEERQGLLRQLLHYGPVAETAEPDTGAAELLLVVPRPGTISPWSSKATDIAHNCGLREVLRLERGTAWYLQLPPGLPEEARGQVVSALHDRMTESVLPALEAASALFRVQEPGPMGSVDILGGGRAALVAADASLGQILCL